MLPAEDPETEPRALRETGLLLVQIRWMAIGAQIVATLFAARVLGLPLPLERMALIIAGLVGFNLIIAAALRRDRRPPDAVLAAQLGIDTLSLAALLALSGGAANPFVVLLLVPLLLALSLCAPAAALPIYLLSNLSVWALVTLVPAPAGGPATALVPAFGLTSTLMAWFVLRLRLAAAARAAAIEALRKSKAEADQLAGLGLLASGMAHELGTPLTTLAVTLDDWAEVGPPEGPAAQAELDRMIAQLHRCRAIVSRTLQAAGRERLETAAAVPAEAEIRRILALWSGARGRSRVPVVASASLRGARMLSAPVLEAALINLLDNAESAAPGTVAAELSGRGGQMILRLTDRGPGFPDFVLTGPAAPFVTGSGAPGRGLGLFLARNAIDRLGGRMELRNTATGAEVRIAFPLLAPATPHETPHD